jgi:hypothetical protein
LLLLLLTRVLLLDRLGLLLIILTRISVSLLGLGGITCAAIILAPSVLHQKISKGWWDKESKKGSRKGRRWTEGTRKKRVRILKELRVRGKPERGWRAIAFLSVLEIASSRLSSPV